MLLLLKVGLIPKVEMVLSWVTQAPLPGGGLVVDADFF
jgi:hypothetical protein